MNDRKYPTTVEEWHAIFPVGEAIAHPCCGARSLHKWECPYVKTARSEGLVMRTQPPEVSA